MPGTIIQTQTRTGPTNPLRADSGKYMIVCLAERGDTTQAVPVRSLAEFQRLFGDRVTYGFGWDDLQTFFEEGGSLAYVARVVGPGATTGNVAAGLLDRAGTPVKTLNVAAASPGPWSSRLTYAVADGTNPSTVRITVRLDGNVVQDENNLPSPTAIVARFAASPWLRFTDAGSTTVAPANNPAVTGAPVALTAGTDDRANVTAAVYAAALGRFGVGLGDGAVAIPGQDTAVHAALIAHANANRRLAILGAAQGSSTAQLTTLAATYNSEYAGLFAPWVQISDGAGGVRAIPPSGYVAGVRNRAHEQVGPWRAPAGGLAVARSVVGVDQAFDRTAGDALDAGRVSAIRVVANSVRLYGWRSLSQDEQNYSLLTGRDMLNRLVVESEKRLEPFVFETIDGRGQLFARIAAELQGMLEPIRSQGGVFERLAPDGTVLDPGYSVNVSGDLNPAGSVANNVVNAQIGVRISPSAALIYLSIVKVGITAAV